MEKKGKNSQIISVVFLTTKIAYIDKFFALSDNERSRSELTSPNFCFVEFFFPTVQCEDISLIIWFSSLDRDSNLKGKSKNLQYVRVQIFSQILDILVVHSIHFQDGHNTKDPSIPCPQCTAQMRF